MKRKSKATISNYSFEKLKLFQTINSIFPINEAKWTETLENEDFDLFILQIREELMTRVLNECNQKFIERACFKHTVDCAYEAWRKVVNANYFVHDNVNEAFTSNSSWIPDVEPEICELDSWSCGNVALEKDYPPKKAVEVKTILSDYQLIQCFEYPPDNVFKSFILDDDSEIPDKSAEMLVHPSSLHAISYKEATSFTSIDDARPNSSILLTSLQSENEFDKLISQVKTKIPEFSSSHKEILNWLTVDAKVVESSKLPPVAVRLDVKAHLRLPPIVQDSKERLSVKTSSTSTTDSKGN